MRISGLIAVLVLSLLAAPALADDPPAGAPITPNRAGEYARLIEEDYASLDEDASVDQAELERDRESSCP